MDSGAYGSSLAGGAFDFPSFIKQPHTIVRLLSWVCAIVVFATITAEGFVNDALDNELKCMFNDNNGACSYGVGIGVIAFLACVVFIILDAYFPQISNATDRKYIVFGDLVFSGVWTFLWFVCFCVLANQWSKTIKIEDIPADAARAVVAFSFFSTICWVLLTLFAFKRYRQGVSDIGLGYTDPANEQTSPYPPSYPPYSSGAPDGYQQSPFDHNPGHQGDGGYQPPAY